MTRRDDDPSTETARHEISRREMQSRLRIAVSVVLAVALVVAVAGSQGCTPQNPTAKPTPGPNPTATAGPSPTSTPGPTPTSTPAPSGAEWDGTYGPGTFTRGPDSCNPAFFGSSFTGTFVVSTNGTRTLITESQQRQSTGSIVNGTGTFTGSGVVGSEPARWTVQVQFVGSANQRRATVSEAIQLTNRNNCGATYQTQQLQVGNAP